MKSIPEQWTLQCNMLIHIFNIIGVCRTPMWSTSRFSSEWHFSHTFLRHEKDVTKWRHIHGDGCLRHDIVTSHTWRRVFASWHCDVTYTETGVCTHQKSLINCIFFTFFLIVHHSFTTQGRSNKTGFVSYFVQNLATITVGNKYLSELTWADIRKPLNIIPVYILLGIIEKN